MSVEASRQFIMSKVRNLGIEENESVNSIAAARVLANLQCGCDIRREFSRTDLDAYVIDSRLRGPFGQPYTMIVDKVKQTIRLEASMVNIEEVEMIKVALVVNDINRRLRLHGSCWMGSWSLHYEVELSFYGLHGTKALETVPAQVVQFFEEDMKEVKEYWRRRCG